MLKYWIWHGILSFTSSLRPCVLCVGVFCLDGSIVNSTYYVFWASPCCCCWWPLLSWNFSLLLLLSICNSSASLIRTQARRKLSQTINDGPSSLSVTPKTAGTFEISQFLLVFRFHLRPIKWSSGRLRVTITICSSTILLLFRLSCQTFGCVWVCGRFDNSNKFSTYLNAIFSSPTVSQIWFGRERKIILRNDVKLTRHSAKWKTIADSDIFDGAWPLPPTPFWFNSNIRCANTPSCEQIDRLYNIIRSRENREKTKRKRKLFAFFFSVRLRLSLLFFALD